ncbi:LpxL/LpxP family acyltransferase [Tessaracoccus sp.]
MTCVSRLRTGVTSTVWTVGSRLPHWVRQVVCTVGPWFIAPLPVAGLRQWGDNVETIHGTQPSMSMRRGVVSAWLRNTLMSLSLARWSDDDVLRRCIVSDDDVAKLRRSLDGPGLVLVLPHMGSWDFAGAWCTRVGIKVLSVAERLPRGVYERFREARAGMGMDILPVGQPDLMRALANAVHGGRAVCLLSDRDLSGRGLEVPWPGASRVVSVPAGPALLSRLTGCDLRVVSTAFRGDSVEIRVGDVIPISTPAVMMAQVVDGFAEAVQQDPTSWLMLQPMFRSR